MQNTLTKKSEAVKKDDESRALIELLASTLVIHEKFNADRPMEFFCPIEHMSCVAGYLKENGLEDKVKLIDLDNWKEPV